MGIRLNQAIKISVDGSRASDGKRAYRSRVISSREHYEAFWEEIVAEFGDREPTEEERLEERYNLNAEMASFLEGLRS